jgi:hypothetical protein
MEPGVDALQVGKRLELLVVYYDTRGLGGEERGERGEIPAINGILVDGIKGPQFGVKRFILGGEGPRSGEGGKGKKAGGEATRVHGRFH